MNESGGTIVWNLDVNDSNFKAGLASARTAAASTAAEIEETLGKKLSTIGTSLYRTGSEISRTVTLPVVALGTAIFKTSSDFEESLNKIVGLVGISRKQVNAWTKDFETLGAQTGKTPDDLAKAMFFITSAGLRGQKALDALTASAKASAAGLGDTAVVADAVTSAMNSYAKSGLSASRATDILAAAVKAGKVDASTIAPVLGNILPIAASLRVRFEDVAGAMASMTRVGLDAATAGTSIRGVLSALIKPGQQAKDALKSVGLNFQDLRDILAKPGGIIQVMRLLNSRFGDNEEAMAAVIPDVRAFRGVMAVLAQDSGSVDTVMGQVANSVGLTNKAFQAASEGPGFKFHQVMSQISSDLINIGDIAAPIMASAMKTLGGVITRITQVFDKLPKSIQKIILGVVGFAAVLGPTLLLLGSLLRLSGLLVGIYGELTVATYALGDALGVTAGTVVVATAGLALLALAAYEIITHWTTVKKWLGDFWNWLNSMTGEKVSLVIAALAPIIGVPLVIAEHWDTIKPYFTNIYNFFVDIARKVDKVWDNTVRDIKAIPKKIENAFDSVVQFFRDLPDKVANGIKRLPDVLKDSLNKATQALINYDLDTLTRWGKNLSDMIDAVKNWGKDTYNQMKDSLKNALKAIEDWGIDTYHSTQKALSNALTAVSDWAINLYNGVKSALGLGIKAIVDWGKDIYDNTKTAISNFGKAISDFVTGLPDALKKVFDDSGQKMTHNTIEGIKKPWGDTKEMQKIGDVIIGGLALILGSLVIAAIDFGTRLLDFIFTGLNNIKDKSDAWGRNLINGLINGVIAKAQSLWNGLSGAFAVIGNFFSGAGGWLYDSGRALVSGFIAGIKSYASGVINAVSGVVGGAIDKAKSLLHIHSPSQVFADIGRNVGAGLVQGIDSTHKNVQSSIADLTGNFGVSPLSLNSNITTSGATGSSASGATIVQNNNIYNQVDLDQVTRDLAWRLQVR